MLIIDKGGFFSCSHDCSLDHGWLRIGVTEVRGGGFSAILEIILRSASVSAKTQRCDLWARPNSVIYSRTV